MKRGYVRHGLAVRRSDYPRTTEGKRAFNRAYQAARRGQGKTKTVRKVALTATGFPDTPEGRLAYREAYCAEWRRLDRDSEPVCLACGGSGVSPVELQDRKGRAHRRCPECNLNGKRYPRAEKRICN